MSEKALPKRLVICVDGPGYDSDGRLDTSNSSNVYRIKSLIATGLQRDAHGRAVEQIVRYYPGTGAGAGRLAASDQQIKDVTREICETLSDPKDELFLFGFSNGAFVVRAVAGVLHQMRMPKHSSMDKFDMLYSSTLDLLKARYKDDHVTGLALIDSLKAETDDLVKIQFVGAFDTVKSSVDKSYHDLSFNSSIRHWRHAVALNENRPNLVPELLATPSPAEMEKRSMVQAWFLGTQLDIGGGAQHDGLSLYPLQWVLLESLRAGLVLKYDESALGQRQNPLRMAFPQYVGDVPKLDGTESIEWNLQYTNGLQVSMFDLQAVVGVPNPGEEATHMVRLNQVKSLYNTQRKAFSSKGLHGWYDKGGYGTIIHPSVYCLLEREAQLVENARIKLFREDLEEFQERYLLAGASALAPWMQGKELEASGVKAFRILVCGKTGVGKSTLINKIFGVEMTEESLGYKQGDHDIEQAFESPNHPGLLLHDSRGWQAGSDTELDLIAKFLRHRAFQKDPAQALHVIWFCTDCDVSRIETADRRTFETIARYSHHVPVFVVGTKKDKLVAIHKMNLLEKHMEETNDYPESLRLANEKADTMAENQFSKLRDELAKIKNYKADGYVCLSKDDNEGVKQLLSQTLELISDERVRIFCVAAQVIDVEQKINSAITECMRLGGHAIRTAMVPLPATGVIGTPTVSRLICEHVLICFGFPKAVPEEVDKICTNIVLKHLKKFMAVSVAQLVTIGGVGSALGFATAGVGAVGLGLVGCFLATPPTARMLFKCSCDMILILERAFRVGGKYVSTKEIEEGAKLYTTTKTQTFEGKQKLIQSSVHEKIDRLIPLTNIHIGFKFSKLRGGMEEIIYSHRMDKTVAISSVLSSKPATSSGTQQGAMQLDADGRQIYEIDDRRIVAEMPGFMPKNASMSPVQAMSSEIQELPGDNVPQTPVFPRDLGPIRPDGDTSTSVSSDWRSSTATISLTTTMTTANTTLPSTPIDAAGKKMSEMEAGVAPAYLISSQLSGGSAELPARGKSVGNVSDAKKDRKKSSASGGGGEKFLKYATFGLKKSKGDRHDEGRI